ncbi:MAG: hypothetical protein CUN56_08980 [Phototrophicales bacterium]|nr:MAG: hypothetical protein CUN56_08980 [Phototrophicales bacterium]
MIATLNQLQRRLNLATGVDEVRLLDTLRTAAAQIERLAGRHFEPRVHTLTHTITHPTQIILQDDLLELDSITDEHGAITVTCLPYGQTPSSILQATQGFMAKTVSISGIWGWHNAWESAWRDSLDTVQTALLSDVATNIPVDDVEGADALNEAPRFQIGQLIRIDAEYMRVLGVQPDYAILQVERGVNGTTATTHVVDTPIYTYQPPVEVASLVVRWAAWLYREPDQRTLTGIPAALMKELASLRRI